APSVKINNYYLLEKVRAYDFFAAVDLAWNSITSKLGILSFFDQNKLLINESALILINGNNTFFKKQITPTIFSSNYESKINLSELDKLYELDVNSQSRINNSLKFINNSVESKSLDTKFINQWVALESIASSNQYKSI